MKITSDEVKYTITKTLKGINENNIDTLTDVVLEHFECIEECFSGSSILKIKGGDINININSKGITNEYRQYDAYTIAEYDAKMRNAKLENTFNDEGSYEEENPLNYRHNINYTSLKIEK